MAAALSDLASRCEVWTFEEGDQIQFPDEGPSGQVWVAEGCLVVSRPSLSPRYVGVRERLEAPAGVAVKGQTSGRFLKVPETAWRAWLRGWPRAAEKLQVPVPEPIPPSLVKSPLTLETDEVLVQIFRKAPLFLFLRAATPLLFFLLFLIFGLVLVQRFGSAIPLWGLWLLPGIGMVVTGALIGLVTWEWSSSMLAMTDRSLIIRQIDVWAHRSDFEKIALEAIKESVFTKQGLWDSFLGLVNLEIEGDSPKGRLMFRGLAQETRFLTAMETLRDQRVHDSLRRQEIRQALAAKMGGARTPRLEQAAERPEQVQPRVRRLSWRNEKDGGIWFRRHPWIVWHQSLPWLGWAGLVGFLVLVAVGFWPQGVWTIAAAGGAAALFPVGRIVWELWDWADDRLSLQGEKVILVHRRPLWFGEVRQEGRLDQVEQIGVRKDSLAALLFDFGTLTISLGASEPLVFLYAHHPELVQNEIFHRRTQLARQRESQAAKVRLDEVSEILDTWDEARKADYFIDRERPDGKEVP